MGKEHALGCLLRLYMYMLSSLLQKDHMYHQSDVGTEMNALFWDVLIHVGCMLLLSAKPKKDEAWWSDMYLGV